MAKQQLYYGDQTIAYQVHRLPQRRSKLVIHVYPNGHVQVEAPMDTPLPEVHKAVSQRGRWLSRHLAQVKAQYAYVLPRQYVSGESHFYLGRRYLLKIRRDGQQQPEVKLRQGQLQVTTLCTDRATIRSLLQQWYRQRAIGLFDSRLGHICEQMPWIDEGPTWKLRAMKKQWGSCSPSGVLLINPHLIKAPSNCIDYVLLHELCHLKVHNHSPRFYRLLNRQMPDWEIVKGRLDGMAELLLNT